MEKKKNPEADLERNRPNMFLTGLVLALAIVLLAFEWALIDTGPAEMAKLTLSNEEEEMIPITQQEPPPPPPPPQQTTVIEIVDDEEELEEELEVEDTEIDEDTEIEIIEVAEEVVEEPQIFTIVEDMPTFPGCENAGNKDKKAECTTAEMFKLLYKNLKYPAMAKDAGVTGTVFVYFVVDEKGNIEDTKILRGIGAGCDEAAIAAVKKFPKFNPGKQRGKPVKVSYNLPIKFSLR